MATPFSTAAQRLFTIRPVQVTLFSTASPRLSHGRSKSFPFFSSAPYFSTGNAMRSNSARPNANPSYPAFSLSKIVPNPRMRAAIYVGFVLMAAAESYMWVTYWPKIMKKGKNEAAGGDDNYVSQKAGGASLE
ncbi:hypothetical protein C7999DRAFT_30107 [Corynascus novoguineensis]|uniref:Uncharacterized protein n=1 Tax=Corynascus novoguineensis TaxID=1126955 RepID=A0AAN7CVW5_9PEZI|nr:hypothetical protein C7999DRAFT_30107 [Corynascus novoguineensis]